MEGRENNTNQKRPEARLNLLPWRGERAGGGGKTFMFIVPVRKDWVGGDRRVGGEKREGGVRVAAGHDNRALWERRRNQAGGGYARDAVSGQP